MRVVVIGSISYRLVASSREGQVVVHAERTDNGDRFGIECAGATEDEAASRLAGWLEWQGEHRAALDALQSAERSYHRTIAGSAFASPIEGPTAIELQKDALEVVEAARVRLDEVRARKPE
jgi:hypothetical protein